MWGPCPNVTIFSATTWHDFKIVHIIKAALLTTSCLFVELLNNITNKAESFTGLIQPSQLR